MAKRALELAQFVKTQLFEPVQLLGVLEAKSDYHYGWYGIGNRLL